MKKKFTEEQIAFALKQAEHGTSRGLALSLFINYKKKLNFI
jgi:hypothetical protein